MFTLRIFFKKAGSTQMEWSVQLLIREVDLLNQGHGPQKLQEVRE